MGIIEKFNREFTFFSAISRTIGRIKNNTPDSPLLVPDVFERIAREKPDNVAILFEGTTYTYRDYEAAANRYARWAVAQGVKRGDCVALYMENRPDYLFAWMGMLKAGATCALINSNLEKKALAHSVNIASAQHLIVGAECAERLAGAIDMLEPRPRIWSTGGVIQGTDDLDAALAAEAPTPLAPEHRAGMTAKEKALYIYTSGTTGLPKAANLSHMRLLNMMQGFAAGTKATEKDRMYVVLPLYHSAGGVCAIGTVITVGGSMVLKRKFSVKEFWDDCHALKPTLFQYIGELCRYLLNAPEHPLERRHGLRLAVGNGLRPEVWKPFQERFAIPRILEFYGATEGNVALFNYDGKVGSIGRIPFWLRNKMPTRIVRFDVEREEPIRGADGLCMECKPGEVGEAIGEIRDDEPRSRFEGYTKGHDTERKILRDVFQKGDRWFRTGDLLRQDEEGYFYFVDRIGDTYRWKGENVATSEVAEVLSVFEGIKEANVYGVKVPGADGRAGMAALVVGQRETFDVKALYDYLERQLPHYARPYFLRLQPEIEITGTFKHRKVDLVQQGFNPSDIPDPIFLRDDDKKTYVALDAATYDALTSGNWRF